MPKVSIIIPCYNQGAWLDDAVDSVLAQTFTDYEIIVVNDGSTDRATREMLADYRRPATRVIHTANQGLPGARNSGIREAMGQYILPLDADDRISSIYLEKGVRILDEGDDIGIVYSLADRFGAVNGPWPTPEYSLRGMLLGNLIFCSALFRKGDWLTVGGYKASMAHGWEDWDFWLSLIELGREVCRIPEVLFHYRVKEGSMAASMDWRKKAHMHLQVMRNHPALFVENSLPLLELYYRITCSGPYRYLKRLGISLRIAGLIGKR